MKTMFRLALAAALLSVSSTGWGQNRYDHFGPVNGILKGSATSYYTTAATSADIKGLWTGTCDATTFLRGDGSCATLSGSGTVTSVGLSMPSGFSVSGTPITGAGSFSVTTALNGILKGTGTGFTTSTAADIYGLWSGTCSVSAFLRGDGACSSVIRSGFQVTDGAGSTNWLQVTNNGSVVAGAPTGGAMGPGSGNFTALYINGAAVGIASGSVSSVGLSLPASLFAVTGSPVTAAGTLTGSFATGQPTHQVIGTGSSGTWGPISLTTADLPLSSTFTFTNTGTSLVLNNSAGPLDNKNTRINFNSFGNFSVSSATDAAPTTAVTQIISTGRSGSAWSNLTLGNSTDNPTYTFSGNGATSLGGSLSVTGAATVGGQNVCVANGTNCSVTGLANPTATIGLTAVNGSASSALRSDGAPALSQAISPSWTGTHFFGGGVISSVATAGMNVGASGGHWVVRGVDTNGGANGKGWQFATGGISGNALSLQAVSDDWSSTFSNALTITRSAAAISNVSIGNPTDNPTYNFNGSGSTIFSGPVNANTSTGVAMTVNGVSGNTALVVNPAASATGIAVVSPASNTAAIAVRGNLNAGSAAGIFSQDASSNVHVANLGAASIDFDTNGVNRVALDQNGNMLLNAPTSGTVLTVNSGSGLPATFNGFNGSSGAALQLTGNFTGAGNTSLLQLTDNNNTNGVNISLVGNGVTNPRKTIRVANGTLQILNNNYSAALLNLQENGNASLVGNGASESFTVSAASSFSSQIQVEANGNTGGSSLLLQQDASHNGYIRNQDTGALFLGTGSTNWWNINASGVLSNGTAPTSGEAFNVASNATSSAVTIDSNPFGWTTHGSIDMGTTGAVESDSGTLNLANNAYFSNPNWIYKTTAAASNVRQDSSGNILFLTATSGTAGTTSTLTSALEVFNDRGITVGSPTGGDKGAGTVNMSGCFVNGVACSTGGSPGGTSGQIQFNNAGAFGGISTTGSGNVVLATSPTLVTPALGTPSAINLTNATALPLSALANQGTATTVLHGNAAGNPSFGAVGLTTDVTGILPAANGGSGNGFFAVSGPATSTKTFAFPNASATVLTTNAAVTVAQGGTGTTTPSLSSGSNISISGSWPNQTVAATGVCLPNGSNCPAGVTVISCTTSCDGSGLTVGGVATIIKLSSTSRNSTISPSIDPDLQFTNLPAGTYRMEVFVEASAAGGGFFMIPSNSSGGAVIPGVTACGTTASATYADTGTSFMACTGSNSANINAAGSSTVTVSGATLGIKWAQNSSNAANTNVLAGSEIVLRRLN